MLGSVHNHRSLSDGVQSPPTDEKSSGRLPPRRNTSRNFNSAKYQIDGFIVEAGHEIVTAGMLGRRVQ